MVMVPEENRRGLELLELSDYFVWLRPVPDNVSQTEESVALWEVVDDLLKGLKVRVNIRYDRDFQGSPPGDWGFPERGC